MKFRVMMMIIPLTVSIPSLHFWVCVLYPRQNLLPPLQRDRGPVRESAWCKVTQQGKSRGRPRAHVILCLAQGPSGRAPGSPLAMVCWLGNRSSRLPEPQFPHLQMAALQTSVCLLESPTRNADWMMDNETGSPSSFQWF